MVIIKTLEKYQTNAKLKTNLKLFRIQTNKGRLNIYGKNTLNAMKIAKKYEEKADIDYQDGRLSHHVFNYKDNGPTQINNVILLGEVLNNKGAKSYYVN